jgi:hypothetical protein
MYATTVSETTRTVMPTHKNSAQKNNKRPHHLHTHALTPAVELTLPCFVVKMCCVCIWMGLHGICVCVCIRRRRSQVTTKGKDKNLGRELGMVRRAGGGGVCVCSQWGIQGIIRHACMHVCSRCPGHRVLDLHRDWSAVPAAVVRGVGVIAARPHEMTSTQRTERADGAD